MIKILVFIFIQIQEHAGSRDNRGLFADLRYVIKTQIKILWHVMLIKFLGTNEISKLFDLFR